MAIKPSRPWIDASNSLATGLVMALPLYEGAGTAVSDVSGNGNSSTLAGSGVAWEFGPYGEQLRLDGTQTTPFSQIATSTVPILGNAGWTFHIFFKAKALPGSSLAYLYAEADSVASAIWNLGIRGSDNKMQMFFRDDAAAFVTGIGSDVLTVDTEYSLTVTYDETGNAQAWLNGVSQGTSNVSGLGVRTVDSADICQDFPPRPDIEIYDIRAWDRILTDAERGLIESDRWALYETTEKWRETDNQPARHGWREFNGHADLVVGESGGSQIYAIFEADGAVGRVVLDEVEIVNRDADEVAISFIGPALNIQTVKKVGAGDTWKGKLMRFASQYDEDVDVVASIINAGSGARGMVRATGRLI